MNLIQDRQTWIELASHRHGDESKFLKISNKSIPDHESIIS